MSEPLEPLETLDKDKQAMSEAIKKDIEKDKENLARVEVDEDTIDDDKLRDEILGVMEELCDTLNDSLNFKKVVCMGIKVSIAFKFLIFCSQSFRKNSDYKDLSFR
ncbi:hypothetical protein HpBT117_01430 [Helicobacter pylori]